MASQIIKAGIVGTLVNNEVWSINPVFQLDASPDVTWDQLNTIATAINALTIGTTMRAAMSNETKVTGVKLEARTQNGQLQVQLAQDRSSAVVGTGVTPHPNQTAAVISLRTTTPGGRGRGRLYWPATGVSILATTGRFNSGVAGSLAAEFKTYLSGINTAISATIPNSSLVVWSRVGLGVQAVNKIIVGDVPDTQRRRRDKAVETYSSVSYP